jgi:hypothetical protein
MAVCTAEELVEGRKKNPRLNLNCREPLPAGEVTVEHAERALRSAFQDVLDRRMPEKGNRPWELVALGEKLDPAQAWLGFEYEMGLNTAEDYRALVTYIWHEHNHVAIDREGIGAHSLEITFPPQNAEQFAQGTAGIQYLLRWMEERGIRTIDHEGRNIGQHVNISTPRIRANPAKAVAISRLINHSLWAMAPARLAELFGRTPYGLSRPRVSNGQTYFEFKVFDATQNQETFAGYVKVSRRLAMMIDDLAGRDLPEDPLQGTMYIANIYDVLTADVERYAAIHQTPQVTARNYIADGFEWRQRLGLSPVVLT